MPISKGKMTAKKMAIPKKTFSVICAKSCESSSSPIFDRFCSKLMCLEERNKTKRVAGVLRGRTKLNHAECSIQFSLHTRISRNFWQMGRDKELYDLGYNLF